MKNNVTELVFIIDRSGSMFGLEDDTIGGFNSTLEEQKTLDGTVFVTTWLFSDNSVMVHDRKLLPSVEPMTRKEYYVGGCTALYDAVGEAIKHISCIHKYACPDDVPAHTIFVIITDGMENASRSYRGSDIKRMISEATEKNGWKFVFLGANIDTESVAENIGIRKEFAADFDTTGDGISDCYGRVSRAVMYSRAFPDKDGVPSSEEIDDIMKILRKKK